MKFKLSSFLVFAFLAFEPIANNALAQSPTPFNCAIRPETSGKIEYEIYIFSHPGCGFSRKAFNDLGEWAQGKPVSLIAMNIIGDVATIRSSESYALYRKYGIQLVDANDCAAKYKNLVPQTYVFLKGNDKAILKLRGWGKDDIMKVEKRIKKYPPI